MVEAYGNLHSRIISDCAVSCFHDQVVVICSSPLSHFLETLGHATSHTVGTYNGLLEVQVTRDRETGKLITTCEHRVLGSSQGTLFTSKIDLGALLYDRVGETHDSVAIPGPAEIAQSADLAFEIIGSW
ncbi:uncharacterized protein BO96DRAFT_350253 [Aspergillus niger CBS 101883]|uniref:Uncharacterized protein n=2 Tax=Aspergillus niger TaxID=5061 RepID=A2Q825_ASPNC|nr:uncharacterized protein BO96DRAFT_350253 [Aspergillus niger CBS 101883]XP_059603137.1 hypothetical protein An01g02820 [Aspergillus niger]PYH51369.1 hypothetical protein BO96DRAFT_350253 [Aspergillus niger CBS 101883]CAK43648.1 hypothetical protein An01g02820 [Aspergillus niger]